MLNVIILAAGQGKRMYSDLPKVLHTIAGKPMLAHVLERASELKAQNTVLVVGHGGAQIRSAFANAPVIFAQQDQQLGTGHAVRAALPALKNTPDSDTCLILYGDVPLVSSATLQRLMNGAADGVALLTENLADPSGYGRILRDSHGNIHAIVEQRDANSAELAITEVNTGILAARLGHLRQWLAALTNNNAQGEYYLTDIIAMAAAQGVAINSTQPEHPWETMGVNSRAQQTALERCWQSHLAQQLLAQGVGLADAARIDIRGTLSCGRDVFIDVGCVFIGQVSLADGVRVGPYCVLEDCVLAAGSSLQAYTHASGAQLEATAQAGPFARLRPGARLGAGAHVGNFVEIKNTQLGAGAKAGHLSYLGDAVIGAQVNIGAGVITCNYDGQKKHPTTIGEHAFIGSDSQLIAPVNIGAHATVGAGSTITKDVAAHSLAVARSPQKALERWRKK